MTGFPNSPRLLKGGIVLVDLDSGAVQRVIALQYNPDTLTRSLTPKAPAESADRSEALRLKGPPVETIRLEAEIDATDQLETGDSQATTLGIHPQLAALETLVYPSAEQLTAANAKAQSGTLEIAPMLASLTLCVWSKNRVVPMRITEFSITEEAFDASLNPIRAKVSLGMRVLSVSDLPFGHRGAGIYMVYQQQKEQLAQKAAGASFASFGIGGIP